MPRRVLSAVLRCVLSARLPARPAKRGWHGAVSLAAAILLPLAVLTGCGSNSASSQAQASGSADLSQVTLRVAHQNRQTKALMEAAGVLGDVPYRIEWSNFPAALPLLEALRANAVDIGVAGDAPTLNAFGQQAPIKIVAAVRGPTDSTNILVPKDSPIRSVTDLKGRTVSPTTRGSIGHYLLLRALEQAGLTPSDVKISFLQPGDATAAFASGELDAWSTWDPYAAAAADSGARVLVSGKGIMSGLSFLDAADKALQNPAKRAAMKDFVARFHKAHQWANTHVEESARVLAQAMGLPQPVTQAMKRRGPTVPVPLDGALRTELQQVADNYAQAGVVPAGLRVESFFARLD